MLLDKLPIKISSMAIHHHRLFLGLNTGSLLVYNNQSLRLLETHKQFRTQSIDFLLVIPEANLLLVGSDSVDGYSLDTLQFQRHFCGLAYDLTLFSSVVFERECPVLVSKIAAATKKKVSALF